MPSNPNVNIRLPPELLAEIDEEAEAAGQNRSALVTDILNRRRSLASGKGEIDEQIRDMEGRLREDDLRDELARRGILEDPGIEAPNWVREAGDAQWVLLEHIFRRRYEVDDTESIWDEPRRHEFEAFLQSVPPPGWENL